MPEHSLSIVHLQYLCRNAAGADADLAGYVLEHMAEIPYTTIMDLAEKTHTSYATVCRFVKKVGASGYRDFKRLIMDELKAMQNAPQQESDYLEQEDLTFSQLNQKIQDFSTSIIENCCRSTTPQLAERISEMLLKADSIYFVGLGTSAITAQYACTKLFRLKTACACDTDVIIAKMKASLLRKGSVLFAVSSSGRTKSILEIARMAHQSGATVISLCDFARSPLANVSDIGICTTVRESNKYIDTDFPLIQGQITIIDILYAYMYHKSRQQSQRNLQRTMYAVNTDKLR